MLLSLKSLEEIGRGAALIGFFFGGMLNLNSSLYTRRKGKGHAKKKKCTFAVLPFREGNKEGQLWLAP
jgi:hypothetical protein